MPYAYRWPRKMETLLIDYLSKHSNYWDNRHKDFYNRIKRRQILIGAKVALSEAGFTIDVNSISKKFKNLRTIFIKEYNKAHFRSVESEKVYEPIWEHYNNLLFLRHATPQPVDKGAKDEGDDDEEDCEERASDDTLKSEDDNGGELTTSKVESQQQQLKNGSELRNASEDDDSKKNNIGPVSSKIKESSVSRRKRKFPTVTTESTTTSIKTLNLDTNPRRENRSQVSFVQDDDPGAFGVLVAHKLRCLSTRNAMMAQTDIIAILQKYILAEIDS